MEGGGQRAGGSHGDGTGHGAGPAPPGTGPASLGTGPAPASTGPACSGPAPPGTGPVPARSQPCPTALTVRLPRVGRSAAVRVWGDPAPPRCPLGAGCTSSPPAQPGCVQVQPSSCEGPPKITAPGSSAPARPRHGPGAWASLGAATPSLPRPPQRRFSCGHPPGAR